jgi:hypothetical protein
VPFPYRFLLFEGLLLGGTLYALLRGGGPERIAALMMVVAWLLSMASNSHTGFVHFEAGVFLVDVALFVGLYLLSLFTTRYWPLWMCAMQGITVLSHLIAVLSPSDAPGYAIMTQFWAYPMQILLIVATHRHRRRLKLSGTDPAWVRSF